MSIDQEACLFSGSSHSQLVESVANHVGLPISDARIRSFPDGEISVQIQENVRGKTVFVLQSLAHKPNYYLMELLIMIDALKRASAKNIVALVPYFAYARQDRKDRARVPITAKLVANLLEKAGANRVLAMDLHTDQIQGFFDIPMDHLQARPALIKKIQALSFSKDQAVVAAPDIGSIRLVKSMADQLGLDYVIIDKRRLGPKKVRHSPIIGDVNQKSVIFVDDLCSTAHTLCQAAEACKNEGAREIYAAITHGLFVEDALDKIEKSPITKLFVSDTISQAESSSVKKLDIVSIAHLIGEAMKCVLYKHSMSALFTP